MRGLLIIVALLQAAIVALLLYLLAGGEHPAAPAPVATPIIAGPAEVDEDRIRRIIRDELAHVRAIPIAPSPTLQAAAEPHYRDITVDRQRREAVERQLAYFRSLNQVPAVEMERLTADIARLAPADRSAALAELARAINAGEIRGLQ